MRKLVFLLLLMVMSAWSLTAENTFIREARDIEWNAQHVRTADDCEIVFWEVSQGLDTDIWAQKLSSTGQVMWGEPIPIVVKPGSQSIASVVRTSDNNFIVMWKDVNEGEYGYIWLQKISPDGQHLWDEEGIQVTESVLYLYNFVGLVANGEGGAFVFYKPLSSSYTATGQNFDQGGNRLWQHVGSNIFTFDSYYGILNAVSDGSGGAIVNYGSRAGSQLLHVSNTGSLIGTNPMLDSSAFPVPSFYIITGFNGEFILYNRIYQPEMPCYLQKMNASGDLLLPNAVDARLAVTNICYPNVQVVPANDGGVYVLLSASISSYYRRSRIQRYDDSFTPIWDAGGTVVYDFEHPDGAHSADLNVNVNGDAWVTWLQGYIPGSTQYSDYDVMVQHFNAEGEAQWPNGGNLLNNTNRTAAKPIVLPYSDHAMFVWQDFQDTMQVLRRQVISSDGELSLAIGGEPFVNTIAGQAYGTHTLAMNDRYFCAWMDNRSGRFQVYYQITDTELNPLLEPNGRGLSDASNSSVSQVIALPDNTVAVLYKALNQGIYSIYLQKIDANGAIVYPDHGILVSSSTLEKSDEKMGCYDGDNYISWLEKNSSTVFVKAQRVSNGQSMWGTSGTVIAQYPYVEGNTYSAKVCGRFFVWSYQNNTGTNQCKLMTILLNPDGSLAPGWNVTGLSLLGDSYTRPQQLIDCGLVGDDLVVLIKYDYNLCFSHIAQKINVAGQRVWNDWGYDILPLVFGSDYIKVQSCIIDDEITLLLLADNDLSMQQINSEGDLLYPEYGVLVTTTMQVLSFESNIVKYDNGSMTVFWIDVSLSEMSAQPNISMRHINPMGQIVGEAPEILYEEIPSPTHLLTASIGNSSILTWNDIYNYPYPDNREIYNSSIMACRIDSSPVGIEDEINIASPMPRLRQNYPNPFNPVTTIAFDLSTAQPASLRVYNIKGQLVKTLLNDSPLTTGTHSITWDGRDEQGNAVAGGIYFYRLTTPDKHLTKKMVMLK